MKYFRLTISVAVLLAITACSEEFTIPPEVQERSAALDDPLIAAIEDNNLAEVERALQSGGDPNAQQDGDLPPLHKAAMLGHVEIGELLIRNHADVNQMSVSESSDADDPARPRLGRTPLHLSVMRNQVGFTELLIRNSADVNARNDLQMTPLDVARSKGSMLEQLSQSPGATADMIAQYETDLAANRSITAVLEKHGARTTEEIEADQRKDSFVEGGGFIGEVNERIRAIQLKHPDALPPVPERGDDASPGDDGGLPPPGLPRQPPDAPPGASDPPEKEDDALDPLDLSPLEDLPSTPPKTAGGSTATE